MRSPGPASSAPGLAPHPLLWRGSQLVRSERPGLDTGYEALSRNLPGGGWPQGMTELLLPQPGIGELRLLMPALQRLPAQRRIVLLQPPHLPCAAGWLAHRFPARQLLWLHPANTADALWAAEQVLKNGSCGALLYWQPHIRTPSLRRLHLAAQGCDTLFFLLRPPQAGRESSPAPLRLALQPAGDHLRVDIIKRRGARHDGTLLLPLAAPRIAHGAPAPLFAEPSHAAVDSRSPDAAQPRRTEPALAG